MIVECSQKPIMHKVGIAFPYTGVPSGFITMMGIHVSTFSFALRLNQQVLYDLSTVCIALQSHIGI